jgi:F-type H+-transporting ATPase subunit delta
VKSLAIARRYARALLLIGKEDGGAETYRKELDGFARLLAKEKQLREAICNPLYDAEGRKKVLQALIKKMGVSDVMKTFLLLLFDKGRIGFAESINEFYQKLADELRGVARATVISATGLSAEAVEKIRGALSKKTGKDIQLEVKQDSALIGGIITRIGDLVLDGSVRTQLLNMREFLKRGERV